VGLPDFAGQVAHVHERIVHEERERVHWSRIGSWIRGRDAEPAEARVQAFDGPLLQPFTFTAVLDPARRDQPARAAESAECWPRRWPGDDQA
jgi:hypothetical protein